MPVKLSNLSYFLYIQLKKIVVFLQQAACNNVFEDTI